MTWAKSWCRMTTGSMTNDQRIPNAQPRRDDARAAWSLRLGHSLVIHWSLVIAAGWVMAWTGRAAALPVPGAELFTNGAVHRFRLEIAPGDIAQLRRSSRKYVPALLREEKEVYKVGLHLKGSTGSFRSVDDKPGFTLEFGRFSPGQKFHGLRKIHLNNSVEDPSYLNELLGGELFRAAGVPAPRVAHAVVELNGRKLGLYVLKEGFTEDFLALHFHKTNGKLYEPDLGHDADEPLKLVSGDGPDDQADLKTLAAAAHEPDLQKRWERLGQVLDLERFVSFVAMEVMTAHRDGYALARNNFRIYHDLDTDRMLFFPHGMDQLYSKADAPIEPKMSGVVARALMETPQGRQLYRQRFALLFTNIFHVSALIGRADALAGQLRPVLSGREGRAFQVEVAVVKDRIAQRHRELAKQLGQPELTLLRFDGDIAKLGPWQAVDKPANGIMEQTIAPGGKAALRIHAGPVTSASWRTKVLLARGRYSFDGAVTTVGVKPLHFGKNQGASLRLTGVPGGEFGGMRGDQGFKTLQVPFEIAAPEQEVQLICELRARSGDAWFDLDSLRVVRLQMASPKRPNPP